MADTLGFDELVEAISDAGMRMIAKDLPGNVADAVRRLKSYCLVQDGLDGSVVFRGQRYQVSRTGV